MVADLVKTTLLTLGLKTAGTCLVTDAWEDPVPTHEFGLLECGDGQTHE